MYNPSQILAAREARNDRIIGAAKSANIITVKANIPGADKRVKESFLIVRYFTNTVLRSLGGEAAIYDGADGIYAVIKTTGENLKERTVEIEKTDPIGRFCDIDVYLKGAKSSLSRGYMRTCYICEQPAFVCARQGNHTVEQLLGVLKSGTREYFSSLIAGIIKQSLLSELNLENKFGLVTPTSQGSHADLNYGVMLKSQDAIIPYLVQLFWAGFNAERTDGLLNKLRPIGMEAEKAMYAAAETNTYKGFIFVAGVLLASVGYVLSRNERYFDNVFSTAAKICKGITNELDNDGKTNGITAYKNYKITGVRGHAEQGFSVVRQAEALIGGDLSSDNLLKVLCRIVGGIEDTVLLKRSKSLEKYLYFKHRISSVDITDKIQLKSLNEECIKNNISIGGSADVLASAIMLNKFRSLWHFDNN
ncbi:MAG: triphosphoribosyl-dephospho-CoA synthase [Clostridiales bacterium]|nr:triphosphoribosyl-dephospho-CoA synthase [Clostridiales bacterium]